jgi:methionyl-tRNA formyltransferase
LPKLAAGEVKPSLQNHDLATYTKIYKFEDGRLDWTKPAWEILNKIRALGMEPGVWSKFAGKSVKIVEAKLLKDSRVDLPGKVYEVDGLMAVKCKDYSLVIEKLQPEGKKQMQGRDFLNGLKKGRDKIFI